LEKSEPAKTNIPFRLRKDSARKEDWRFEKGKTGRRDEVGHLNCEIQNGLTRVIKFANIGFMKYAIEYFHSRVKAEIESWPDGILADYARLVELLMGFGPNLRMPHSRAMGGGLFELRPRGREGMGRAFYCFVVDQRAVVLHAFLKKTQETPERELRIARRRMKEVQNG
jgi:phage-related protein